jgi:hypothetical protein
VSVLGVLGSVHRAGVAQPRIAIIPKEHLLHAPVSFQPLFPLLKKIVEERVLMALSFLTKVCIPS